MENWIDDAEYSLMVPTPTIWQIRLLNVSFITISVIQDIVQFCFIMLILAIAGAG